MNNTYKFDNVVYTMKPVTLTVMKSAMPLMARLRLLQYEYTKDIDMSAVNRIRNRLAELETAKEQLNELLSEGEGKDNRIEIAGRIGELNEKILAYKSELEINEPLKQKIKLYNECSALAVYEVLTDTELVSPVFANLLSAAGGNIVEIDFNSPGAMEFISKVITDFFLLIAKNRKEPPP